MTKKQRHVFFLSDGTGITAETLGATLLTQFEGLSFEKATLSFINIQDKARATLDYINHAAATATLWPTVFFTTVSDEIRGFLHAAQALLVDLFDALELDLEQKSNHAWGRDHGLADAGRYNARIAAMNYAMEHDDGQSTRDLTRAEMILIAPSRCGKTPTSLYLALQHDIFATRFPLT